MKTGNCHPRQVSAFVSALGAAFALLAGCWAGTPEVIVRHEIRYLHDEPLSCARLKDDSIQFPSAVDISKPQWVGDLGRWVTAAGACLGIEVYDVSWFIEPVRATATPDAGVDAGMDAGVDAADVGAAP